jgi:hypothetical protein
MLLLCSSPVLAAPVEKVATLTSKVVAVASDEGFIYALDADEGTLVRVAKQDGATKTKTLAKDRRGPTGLVRAGETLAWLERDAGVLLLPRAGGQVVQLPLSADASLLATDGKDLFVFAFVYEDQKLRQRILQVAQGKLVLFLELPELPIWSIGISRFTAGADAFYLADAQGTIVRVDRVSKKLQEVAKRPLLDELIAGGGVVWANQEHGRLLLPGRPAKPNAAVIGSLAAGTLVTIAPSHGGNEVEITGLAPRGTDLVFLATETRLTPPAYACGSCIDKQQPIHAGLYLLRGGKLQEVASGQHLPRHLTVDGTHAYWIDEGVLLRAILPSP